MGITYFKRYRMQYDLRRELPAASAAGQHYRFLPWSPELLNWHAEAKFRSFQYELDANVFPCLGQRDGCVSLMREISSRYGFVPQATWLVVKDEGPHAKPVSCGTVQGINDQQQIGSIQNLGVVPAHRGHGLAQGLLVRALTGFREAGLQTASLEVTARNTAAIGLYEKFGFRTVQTVFKSIELVGI